MTARERAEAATRAQARLAQLDGGEAIARDAALRALLNDPGLAGWIPVVCGKGGRCSAHVDRWSLGDPSTAAIIRSERGWDTSYPLAGFANLKRSYECPHPRCHASYQLTNEEALRRFLHAAAASGIVVLAEEVVATGRARLRLVRNRAAIT